jgi:hypothetical protein
VLVRSASGPGAAATASAGVLHASRPEPAGGLVMAWESLDIADVLAAAHRYELHRRGMTLPGLEAWRYAADGTEAADRDPGTAGCAVQPSDDSTALGDPDPGSDAVPASAVSGHVMIPPGPALAGWLTCTERRELDDAALVTTITGWRKLTSWAQAHELAAVAELARRRGVPGAHSAGTGPVMEPTAGAAASCGDPAGGQGPADRDQELAAEFAANEVALALTLTRNGAEYWMDFAVSLAGRLPRTLAALSEGKLDLNRAKLIDQSTGQLSDGLARRVEDKVLTKAGQQTSGQLRAALQRAVISVDPAAAERRRVAAEKNARVELFGDDDGTASLGGRFLPAAQAAAAWARICAMAKAMQSAGAGGGADLLRAQVFVGLLLGTLPLIPPALDSEDDPGDDDEPGDGGYDWDPDPADDGPDCSDQSYGSAPDASGQDASGPDSGGPDSGGPDSGGPDSGGPDSGGPDSGGPGPKEPATSGFAGRGPRSGSRDGSKADRDDQNPTAPGGTAPAGSSPGGTAPAGSSPGGTAPAGSSAEPAPGDVAGSGLDRRDRHPVPPGEGPSAGDGVRAGWPPIPAPGQSPAPGCAPDWPGGPPDPGQRDGPAACSRAAAGKAGRTGQDGRAVLTVPWRTLAGLSGEPGALSRIGPVTAEVARGLASAAATDGRCMWRLILVGRSGKALAVTTVPRTWLGTAGAAALAPTSASSPARAPCGSGAPPRPRVAATTPSLVARVTITLPIAALDGLCEKVRKASDWGCQPAFQPALTAALRAGSRARQAFQAAQSRETPPCSHRDAVPAYRVPGWMRALIEARDQTCRFPCCRQPAWRCDQDHSLAYERGGRTCPCNLGSLCRHHHQLKQLPGWLLTQARPGVVTWRTPAGLTYTVGPEPHQA